MKFRLIFCFILFLVVGALAASPTTIIGVVLEAESDLPVKDVAVSYKSGKRIGETDSRGRFELSVDSKNATLVFKKEGFDSVFVDLQDFADLLDMVITLSTNVTNLGASTIIGDGEPIKWNVERTVQLEKLEDATKKALLTFAKVGGSVAIGGFLGAQLARRNAIEKILGRELCKKIKHAPLGCRFPGQPFYYKSAYVERYRSS